MNISGLNIQHTISLYDRNNYLYTRYAYAQDTGALKIIYQISFNNIEEIRKTYLDELLIATEDKEFWSDSSEYYFRGVNLKGIARAFTSFGKLGGGSSIPMQMVKFMRGDVSLSFNRKLTDIIGAINTYTTFSKNDLLKYYCDFVPIGDVYGFKAASLAYLGKDLNVLNKAELALLVSSVKGGIYCQFKNFSKPEIALKVKDRRNRVIITANKIFKNRISFEKADTSQNLPSKCCWKNKVNSDPYINYSEYVIAKELPLYLKLDSFYQDRYKDLNIYTSLDTLMQNTLVKNLKKSVTGLSSNGSIHGAMVVYNNNHELIAMADERPGNDFQQDLNYSRLSFQAGSTIKPFAYALHMEKNSKNRHSLILDGDDPGCKDSPKNYSGTATNRKMPIIWNLKESSNKAAFNLMCQKHITPMELAADLRKMNITSHLDESNYRMPLGTDNFYLPEIVKAYTVFSNEGNWYSGTAVNKIIGKTSEDKFYIKSSPNGIKIYPKSVNNEIVHCLKEVVKSGTAKKMPTILKSNSFGKTGTTNLSKDVWFIGQYRNITAGIWVGVDKFNYPNSRLPGHMSTGGSGCVPIWSEIICKYFNLKCNSL